MVAGHSPALPPGWIDDNGIPKVPVAWDDRGGLIYALQPKQYEALLLTPLLRAPGTRGPTKIGYGGAAGGGKSFLARVIALLAAFLWPGSTSIIFRKTEGEVIGNHLLKFYQEVPRHLWSYNGKLRMITWWNGSRTFLGYLKKDRDVFTYQGNEYDVMLFEEATHYSWFAVQWLMSNRNRASVSGTTPFAFFPSNPGNIGHFWYRRLFIDREYDPDADEQPEDYAFLQAFLSDNLEFRRRDPSYERKLNQLDEPWRSWLRDGDFEAGAGAALPMLKAEKHMVAPFPPLPHWFCFGTFDWGYSHPFSFGYWAVDEDGRLYLVDSIRGYGLGPTEIGERIKETAQARGLDLGRLRMVYAGPDAFADKAKSLGIAAPTIAEKISAAAVLNLVPGEPMRVVGLNNMREQLRWEHSDPTDPTGQRKVGGEANLVLMETPGNRPVWECLKTRVQDPDNPEDVLKTNADEFGRGGDDDYDMVKLAVNSRPARTPATFRHEQISAFDPAVLAHEADQKRRGKHPRNRTTRANIVLPEGGSI